MKLIKRPSLGNDSYSKEKLYGLSLSALFPEEGRESCSSSCGQRRPVNLSSGCVWLPSPWNREQPSSQGRMCHRARLENHILGHQLSPNHMACNWLVLLSNAYALGLFSRARVMGRAPGPLQDRRPPVQLTYRYKLAYIMHQQASGPMLCKCKMLA